MIRILAMLFCLTALKAYAQEDTFKPGRYYDKNGKMISGYIDLSEIMMNTLKFKPAPDREVDKLNASKLKGFVVESDSFTIIRNFNVESSYSNNYNNTVWLGLAKILETGKVVLYQVYYADGGGYTSNLFVSGVNGAFRNTYMLRQEGSNRIMEVEMGIDGFVKDMTDYFRMSPEICEKIRNKEYSYLKVQQLVKDFNEWYRNR